jgi:hypothetical protein
MKSNTQWSKARIKRVAGASGKPLEVGVAEAFVAKGWKAHLGTYFDDDTLRPLRELDVLAERDVQRPGQHREYTVRLRALVSCKGFAPDQSPLTYSVASAVGKSLVPNLISSHRVHSSSGTISRIETEGAAELLSSTGFAATPPLVAFDVVARKVVKQRGQRSVDYKSIGDRRLFEGIDSALKAALHWRGQDYSSYNDFATLNVPMCIVSQPFWDIPINSNGLGEPIIREYGFQTVLLPRKGAQGPHTDTTRSTESPVILISTVAHVGHVVKALESLHQWFVPAIDRLLLKPP